MTVPTRKQLSLRKHIFPAAHCCACLFIPVFNLVPSVSAVFGHLVRSLSLVSGKEGYETRFSRSSERSDDSCAICPGYNKAELQSPNLDLLAARML